MYLVFTYTRNLLLSNDAENTVSYYVYFLYWIVVLASEKKVRAKNTANAISLDVIYLIEKRLIEKKLH